RPTGAARQHRNRQFAAAQGRGGRAAEERKNQPTLRADRWIDAERSQIQPATGILPRIPPVSLPHPPLSSLRIHRRSLSGVLSLHLPGSAPPLPSSPPPAGRRGRLVCRREERAPPPCARFGCRIFFSVSVLRGGVRGAARRAMDRDERLRRALAAFGGDAWALVDAALAAAARDRPGELRARRDGIVERLYAGAGCSTCDARPLPPPRAALAAAGLDEEDDGEEAAPASSEAAEGDAAEEAEELGGAGGGGDDDGELPGLESKIVTIRDLLEDPDQPEDELVSLLQNLEDMDVTYKVLQETDIGRQVNGLRKHSSAEVRRLVKQLVRKWKEIVDDWVRLHNSGGDGGSSIIADGDSPDKIQGIGRSHQSPRVSGSQYSPSPQRHNGSTSERVNNGFEPTMDMKRKASPVPTHHNSRQMNNNHHSTTISSAPAKVTRDHKDSLLDLDRLDSARKRLQENYQEAQNAKKQRTIQVMDINEIPKPKNRNAFIRKNGSGGLPARHR
ncbi:unnamed protein product, partial [Urochloa humidicola]